MNSLLVVTLTRRLGGAERMIFQLLEGLRDTMDVSLGLVESGSPPSDAGGSGEGRGRMPWTGPTVGLREILFGRYDIIHSHLFLPGVLVRIRRMWDGSFRWIHTVHYGEEAYDSMSLGPLRRWLDRHLVFPHADRLVAVSPSIARDLGRRPNVRTIENAIPLEPGNRDRSDAGGARTTPETEAASTPVLGTVAHLRKEKGVADLLEAIRRLGDRGRAVRLRIAGDGPEADALRRRARDLGIDAAVEFCGFVTDLDSFYRSLDAYVQPSHVEAFGIAALESMRFSLPLVARSVGNLPRLLGQGEYGVLVDPAEPGREGGRERARGPARGSDPRTIRGSDPGTIRGKRAGTGGEDPKPFRDAPGALADGIERVLDAREEYRKRARRGLDHWRVRYDPEEMVRRHRALYREAMQPAVCMIAPVVTQASGGIQRQIHLQTRSLAERGHRVFLVQRSDPDLSGDHQRPGEEAASDADPSPLPPEKARRWSHVTILGTGRLDGARSGPAGLFDRVRGIVFIGAGLVRLWQLRRRIDVLHAHQLHSPTILGVLGKRLLLLPLVSKVTSSGEMGESAEIHRLPFTGSRLRALREVDRLLVLTPHMAREVAALGAPRERIRLVPNCVEIPEPPSGGDGSRRVPSPDPSPSSPSSSRSFSSASASSSSPSSASASASSPSASPEGPFRLLFVGRISTEKRLKDLLTAARTLALEGEAVDVDLVGAPDPDRDAEPALRRMVEAWEAEDRATSGASAGPLRVRFRGHRDDVERFYQEAHAFVLPSSTEGLSNALLEAMAHGVPCVASDIPQNQWALGGAGLLHSTKSAEDLARILRRLVRDRKEGGELLRRLSEGARARAESEFSVEGVVERLRAVYEEVTIRAAR